LIFSRRLRIVRSLSTAGMIKSELSRFHEIVGDKPIGAVTKDDIRRREIA